MAESHVVEIKIEEEIRKSYLDYALSVIIGRAIPDLRDGLKPVQRRIVYAMHDMGNTWNRPYKKSARIVGDVIGKYHPHGDAAVYDSIVRMAQDFNMRYPLIDGQGNFGSIDGDPPAAMRYTEIRLHRIAGELLRDIDKETVKFVPNYDSSLMEPEVLPSRLPNLLINGSSGIAVGMATNIPPHNLCEVVDGLILLLEDAEVADKELLRTIKGPDFPTGGILIGTDDVKQAYLTGKGIVKVRAKTYIETRKGDKASIIIHELPYQVNKSKLIEKISELARNKVLEGIEEIRDETDREGTRIVLDIRRRDLAEVILNKLFKHTQLETNFGIIFLAIDNGMPKVLPLREILSRFLQFRKEIVLNRTRYELQKARDECHVLEGLKIALQDIDLVLNIIRGSKDPRSAKEGLMSQIKLSERQAQAILEMRLQRLTRLEKEKILQDYKELKRKIREYEEILGDEGKVRELIRSELLEIRGQYGDERRTDLLDQVEDINYEDLIFEENMVITITHRGYIKRTPLSLFRTQKRGGKGMSGITVAESDYVDHLFVTTTHTYMLIFTDIGKVYWLKVHQVPEAGRAAKGRPIVNLIPLQSGENVTTVLPVRDFGQGSHIVMATQRGYVKKTSLNAFSHPRSTGIIAINLDPGDKLMAAVLTDEDDRLFFASRNGMSLLIQSGDVREMGRTARGVRAIRLRGDDSLISMINVRNEDTILTITDKGFGKRTQVDRYRLQKRGGVGIINIRLSEKNGKVVRAFQVSERDDIVLMTNKGTLIRIPASDIKVVGRNTMGVKLMNVNDEERVVSAQKVMEIE